MSSPFHGPPCCVFSSEITGAIDTRLARFRGPPTLPRVDSKTLPEKQQPFAFAAVTPRNLIRGELITFYVDGNGHVTADKLDFIKGVTRRLAKAPADA